jgi:hypothetical protein
MQAINFFVTRFRWIDEMTYTQFDANEAAKLVTTNPSSCEEDTTIALWFNI